MDLNYRQLQTAQTNYQFLTSSKNRAEMDKLGWDSCDIIVVTGDAYVDHPSFGMAVIGRVYPGPKDRCFPCPAWRIVAAGRRPISLTSSTR